LIETLKIHLFSLIVLSKHVSFIEDLIKTDTKVSIDELQLITSPSNACSMQHHENMFQKVVGPVARGAILIDLLFSSSFTINGICPMIFYLITIFGADWSFIDDWDESFYDSLEEIITEDTNQDHVEIANVALITLKSYIEKFLGIARTTLWLEFTRESNLTQGRGGIGEILSSLVIEYLYFPKLLDPFRMRRDQLFKFDAAGIHKLPRDLDKLYTHLTNFTTEELNAYYPRHPYNNLICKIILHSPSSFDDKNLRLHMWKKLEREFKLQLIQDNVTQRRTVWLRLKEVGASFQEMSLFVKEDDELGIADLF
jgi:hypothetical protein